MLLLIGVGVFLHAPDAGRWWQGRHVSFGKSRARLMGEDQIKTKILPDVAGWHESHEDVKEPLGSIMAPISYPGGWPRSG